MATIDLDQVPRWTQVRSEAGLFAADAAVINMTNYPESKAFHNPEHASRIAVYWDANVKTAGDSLILELLIAESGATGPDGWIRAARVAGVEDRVVAIFPTMASSICYIRVVAVTVDPATADLEVHAAYLID